MSDPVEFPPSVAAAIVKMSRVIKHPPDELVGSVIKEVARKKLTLNAETATAALFAICKRRKLGDLVSGYLKGPNEGTRTPAAHPAAPAPAPATPSTPTETGPPTTAEPGPPEQNAPAITDDGVALFSEVVACLKRHYHFEEEWHYTVVALFIFQSWVARAGALPAVFYIFFGGSYSSGKSNVLFLVCRLTDGLLVENISLAALARSMKAGRAVFIDEVDVSRGTELDDPRDAMLRSGYRRNGPPYIRFDPKANMNVQFSVFGPKGGTYRSVLDQAFQSRGFTVPTAKFLGETGYDLVLANLWSKTADLVPRLRAWGEAAAKEWPDTKLEEHAGSEEFREKLRDVVAGRKIGANRESELFAIALLVADMIDVKVVPQLKEARELREMEISADQNESLEEMRDVVRSCIERTDELVADPLTKEKRPLFRVHQTAVRDAINRRRKDRGEKALSVKVFPMLRRELGVKDSYLKNHHGALVWNLPEAFVVELRQQVEEYVEKAREKAESQPSLDQPPTDPGSCGVTTVPDPTPNPTPLLPHTTSDTDSAFAYPTPTPYLTPNPTQAVSDVKEGGGGGQMWGKRVRTGGESLSAPERLTAPPTYTPPVLTPQPHTGPVPGCPGPDPEDLFVGEATRADRARAGADNGDERPAPVPDPRVDACTARARALYAATPSIPVPTDRAYEVLAAEGFTHTEIGQAISRLAGDSEIRQVGADSFILKPSATGERGA